VNAGRSPRGAWRDCLQEEDAREHDTAWRRFGQRQRLRTAELANAGTGTTWWNVLPSRPSAAAATDAPLIEHRAAVKVSRELRTGYTPEGLAQRSLVRNACGGEGAVADDRRLARAAGASRLDRRHPSARNAGTNLRHRWSGWPGVLHALWSEATRGASDLGTQANCMSSDDRISSQACERFKT
jgi:hypothetical protein